MTPQTPRTAGCGVDPAIDPYYVKGIELRGSTRDPAPNPGEVHDLEHIGTILQRLLVELFEKSKGEAA